MVDKNFDNKQYWKKRMLEKLTSLYGTVGMKLDDLLSDAAHVDLDTNDIADRVKELKKDFAKVQLAVMEAKEIKKEVKQS